MLNAGDVPSPTSMMLPPGLNPEITQLGLQSQEVGLGQLTSPLMSPLSRGLAIDVANRLRDLATGGMETTTSPMMNGTNSLLSHSPLQLRPNSLVGLQSVIGGDAPSSGHRIDSSHVSTAR